ncbi:hypothetical protein VSX64_23865 [Aurantimonas sp. C2-6-R+9]|uniref:hypothetical protein n=1 Tax=unclassified Aurantimonas TaxID=2638230 RepID=UPI002E196A87|nr:MULTISPECIES: hypothetical protein [unclassified Aurantimonas]MEC5293580.1 hypothetical protein [Aurantimonas sp. C2-3-R2]MEC5383774.1 hypothetical protein [Aurantimonas sp. C2-6-R+9]MEC5414649.1 hypothetical protein [Aurantimonas sp. C2-4-R8]
MKQQTKPFTVAVKRRKFASAGKSIWSDGQLAAIAEQLREPAGVGAEPVRAKIAADAGRPAEPTAGSALAGTAATPEDLVDKPLRNKPGRWLSGRRREAAGGLRLGERWKRHLSRWSR